MSEEKTIEALQYKIETLQQAAAKQKEDKKKLTGALQQLVNDLSRIQKLLDDIQARINPCLLCKGFGKMGWFNEKTGNYDQQHCRGCAGWGYTLNIPDLVPELIEVLRLIGRK